MNSRVRILVGIAVCCMVVSLPCSHASWLKGLVNGVRSAVGGSGGAGPALTDQDIAGGLREALRVGIERAVALVSKDGGYLNNPAIAIPLPSTLEKTEKLLRLAGFGATVDDFRLSMNRAAERAAPEARAVFFDAIRDMSFADVRAIWQGPDDAATQYFQTKTQERLTQLFRPIVGSAMTETNVTATYKAVEDKVRTVPFAGQLTGLDLDGYVTGKALDGLFHVLAEEEGRIRRDPTARATELLQRVFGAK